MTSSKIWIQRIAEAVESYEREEPDSAGRLADTATAAHAALVGLDGEGHLLEALRIAEALEPLTRSVYQSDPQSQHALWHDYGVLLCETGRRDYAASVLRSALQAEQQWTANVGWHEPDTQRIRDLSSLGTKAALVGVLSTFGDSDGCDHFFRHYDYANAPWRNDKDSRPILFQISYGQHLATKGELAKAEEVLQDAITHIAGRHDVSLAVGRAFTSLSTIYLRRRRYDKALMAIERSQNFLTDLAHRDDLANAVNLQAVIWFRIAGEDTESDAWQRAWALNQKAVVIRASARGVLPSAGCAEEALLATMALYEGRLADGRRHLAKSIRLARRVWKLSDDLLLNALLTSAGLSLATGRPRKAWRKTGIILALADERDAAKRQVLLSTLPVHAEASRRMGRPWDAVEALEKALALEAEMVDIATAPAWTPHDVSLIRRGHEMLNAYVDACLALGDQLELDRMFAQVAASKDLGLRTLRSKRGAAGAELKVSTLPDDLAAALPPESSYLEFFLHVPRIEGTIRSRWAPAQLLAFTIESNNPSSLRLWHLGPARVVDDLIRSLPTLSEYRRRQALTKIGFLLADILEACASGTVFIAPDGILHALPFGALPESPRITSKLALSVSYILPSWRPTWLESARLALVESAAMVLRYGADRGATQAASVVTIADVGGHTPYPVLRHAEREGYYVASALGATPLHIANEPFGADKLRDVLDKAKGVVHLAGHADVFTEASPLAAASPALEALTKAIDPYDQCRLICPGFNDWISRGEGLERIDDVSVSARQLAAFDLRQVKLLVLSTCQGAIGLPQPLESAASLATAARAAGAGTVIAAVWGVPDEATSDLMVGMHRAGMFCSPVDALRLAQLTLQRRNVSDWAGFVAWASPRDLEDSTGLHVQTEKPAYWGGYWTCYYGKYIFTMPTWLRLDRAVWSLLTGTVIPPRCIGARLAGV